MAKRRKSLTTKKPTHSRKTKKRLAIKAQMLANRPKRKRRAKQ